MGKKKTLLGHIDEAAAVLKNTVEISEPPCKNCKHFTPRATTDKFGQFNGICMCSAESMYRDFSCAEGN